MRDLGRRQVLAVIAAGLAGCTYGREPDRRNDFVVLFDGTSETLDPEAMRIVTAAAWAARTYNLNVTVAGYADAAITPESNQIRSRIRAQLVAEALVGQGVSQARITLTPRRGVGADPGSESRRVEIRLEP